MSFSNIPNIISAVPTKNNFCFGCPALNDRWINEKAAAQCTLFKQWLQVEIELKSHGQQIVSQRHPMCMQMHPIETKKEMKNRKKKMLRYGNNK